MAKTYEKEPLKPYEKLNIMIEKYSKVIEGASSKYIGFFNARYKLNQTIKEMAKEWNKSEQFVKKLQSEFMEYLYVNLNKEGK